MVPIRFTSLVLGLLLVLQALRVSLTQAHQDMFFAARAMNGNKLAMTGENVLMVQKELLDGEPKAATRVIGLGGRKMVVDRVSRKGIKDDQQGLNQENSKISGKDSHAWKKFVGKSPNTLNEQDHLNSLEPKTRKCSSLGCASKSKVVPVSQEPPDSTADQREEAERLLKAMNEIVNLIHKDYKGNEKPKRKPPINNHEPSD